MIHSHDVLKDDEGGDGISLEAVEVQDLVSVARFGNDVWRSIQGGSHLSHLTFANINWHN